MKCMKCGRELTADQIFCEDCLADMEKYPVKPDTPVVLPQKDPAEASRRAASRRRFWKPEYTIVSLRRWIIFLILLCAALAIALTISISMLRGGNPLAPLGFSLN